MKVRNLRLYISNSAEIQGLWNASSVLHWPPTSFPILLTSLTGGTGQNQLACLSVLVVQWDQTSLLKLGQCYVHVFTLDFEFVSCQYWPDPLSLILCFIHVTHCQTKVYSFSKLETSTHCFWFLWVRSHSKSTFPQSNFEIVWGPY